ncbi:MAG: hypothetical protein ACI4PQ_07800 [Butyricicoccaceae bacterium]
MKIPEYDAFGPWIYEIDEDYPVPPLFLPYVNKDATPLISFKVPRELERRKISRDMDLYDYLITAYEDHIQVLKRTDYSAEETNIPYSDIEGIKSYRCLLRGVCTIYTKDGNIEFAYNTVSSQIVTKFIQIVRSKYLIGCPKDRQKLDIHYSYQGFLDDTLFFHTINDLRNQGENFRIGAFQPVVPIRRKNEKFAEAIWTKLQPPTLPSTLHLFNDHELLIIQRGKATRAKRKTEYSFDYTYLPLGKIEEIYLSESIYDQAADCQISLPGRKIRMRLHVSTPDSIHFYQALAAAVNKT